MAVLFDNGNFRYTAQVRPTRWGSQSGFTLAFLSQWQDARNPNEEQVRFFACLDRDGLERLGALINQQLARQQLDPENGGGQARQLS